MQNLITIENQNAVVTLNTILAFSGLSEQAVKKVVKRKIETLIKNGLSYPYDLSEDLNYSEMKFDEKSCTLLLTLLPNNEVTEKFKEDLVNAFFKMRDEIQSIKIEAVKQAMLEDKKRAVAEAKKMNTYNINGLEMITVGKYAKEYSDLSPSFIWDALEAKGLVNTKIVPTKFRKLPKHVPEYIGATIKGSSTPIYLKQVIDNAIATYEPMEECQDESFDEDI